MSADDNMSFEHHDAREDGEVESATEEVYDEQGGSASPNEHLQTLAAKYIRRNEQSAKLRKQIAGIKKELMTEMKAGRIFEVAAGEVVIKYLQKKAPASLNKGTVLEGIKKYFRSLRGMPSNRDEAADKAVQTIKENLPQKEQERLAIVKPKAKRPSKNDEDGAPAAAEDAE